MRFRRGGPKNRPLGRSLDWELGKSAAVGVGGLERHRPSARGEEPDEGALLGQGKHRSSPTTPPPKKNRKGRGSIERAAAGEVRGVPVL